MKIIGLIVVLQLSALIEQFQSNEFGFVAAHKFQNKQFEAKNDQFLKVS